MNRIRLVVLLFLISVGMQLHANVNEITQAFARGDLSKIEGFLNNNVELTIENSSNSCDKCRAKALLAEFFRKNRPSNYSLTNKTERGGAAIILGNLYTNTGEFTLFILTQKNMQKELIHQVKITYKK